jgi:predicted DsbA family dithiol-disulfide isomerase
MGANNTTSKKAIFGVLVLCLLGAGAFAVLSLVGPSAETPNPTGPAEPPPPRPICAVNEVSGCPSGIDEAGRPWLGAANPKVTIEEFSDYECLPCRRGHREVRALLAEFRDEVRLVHHDYPVDSECNPAFDRPIHTKACGFARAARCAGEQGKFWEMNDALTERLETTSAAALSIEQLAQELRLDAAKLAACLASEETKAALSADVEAGLAAKIPSTPAYLIRTSKMDGMHIGMLPREVLVDHLQGKVQ